MPWLATDPKPRRKLAIYRDRVVSVMASRPEVSMSAAWGPAGEFDPGLPGLRAGPLPGQPGWPPGRAGQRPGHRPERCRRDGPWDRAAGGRPARAAAGRQGLRGFWPGSPGPVRGPKAGRGDVRAAILALLREEPRNGYQIMSEIEERSGGALAAQPRRGLPGAGPAGRRGPDPRARSRRPPHVRA